jgi:hypothetical protein
MYAHYHKQQNYISVVCRLKMNHDPDEHYVLILELVSTSANSYSV